MNELKSSLLSGKPYVAHSVADGKEKVEKSAFQGLFLLFLLLFQCFYYFLGGLFSSFSFHACVVWLFQSMNSGQKEASSHVLNSFSKRRGWLQDLDEKKLCGLISRFRFV